MEFERIYTNNLAEIYKLSERVYFRKGNWDEKLQCNGGYILLDKCTIAVDFPTVEAAKDMVAESLELFGRPVKYLFLTHAHPDHIYGLPHFAGMKDVILLAGWNCRANLNSLGVAHPRQFVGIRGQVRFSIDDLEIELEKLPVRAHSPWDSFLYLPDENILFTGDLVVPQRYMFLKDCALENWNEMLKKLMRRHIDVLARGHGDVCGSDYLCEQSKYIEALIEISDFLRKHYNFSSYSESSMGALLNKLANDGLACAQVLLGGAGPDSYAHLVQLYDFLDQR